MKELNNMHDLTAGYVIVQLYLLTGESSIVLFIQQFMSVYTNT